MRDFLAERLEEIVICYAIFITILFVLVSVYALIMSSVAKDLTQVVNSKDTELIELRNNVAEYRVVCENDRSIKEETERKLEDCEKTLAQNSHSD